ncbi:predicted protein [Arabidopsis lyrata subsp. lyrata]|uniref:Predicted protein n=1 Tax=Arabidopsis lyrata subsp. lyrata TaxID=81972 RepID=D7LBC1_ARALL|nr:predicted protein [Arabidopsis lyrata subsp. lyrata]
MSGALAWQVKKLILNKKKRFCGFWRGDRTGYLFFPGSLLLCVSCFCSLSPFPISLYSYCSYILKNRS